MLAYGYIHWINMNVDIEEAIKSCPMFLHYQATKPKEKVMSHKIPRRLWESVRSDIFTINSKYYLYIVDYHSKFLVVK